MTFLELTYAHRDGETKKVFVNPVHVIAMEPNMDGDTVIQFVGGYALTVAENPVEILQSAGLALAAPGGTA